MKKLRILIPVILALFLISNISLAKDKIMPLSQIKPGMKGIGKSVLKGTKISEFDVEIVGIMSWGTRNIIVAKLSGIPQGMEFPLEKTGVVAGMSGSPVYINGKNIGAIAYNLNQFPFQTLAGITPIEETLKINESSDSSNEMSSTIYQTSEIPLLFSTHPEKLQAIFEKHGLNLKILPMTATGMNSNQETNSSTELRPGSSITITYMRGDSSFEGTGTVTYVDGDKIYALGHPIFYEGNTSVPFYLSKILAIAQSHYYSYKITEGLVGNALGSIILDRPAGVMGIMGKEAKMIPLEISFKNKDLINEFNVEVAKFKYSHILMYFAVRDACDKFLSRKLDTNITLKVHSRIIVREKPEIRNINYFVLPKFGDPDDFSYEFMVKFFSKNIYAPLITSRFPVDFERINLDIEVLEGRKVYSLNKAFLTKGGKLIEGTSVKPGDIVELSVVLENADTLEKSIGKLTIPIPENVGEGDIEILINDSESYNPRDPSVKKKVAESLNYPENLEELIKALNEKLDKSRLYIQIIYPKNNKNTKEKESQETTTSKSEQNNEPNWKNWEKVENADELPLLKDEKPSELIKQIIVPLEFEGLAEVEEELSLEVKKPEPIVIAEKKQPSNSGAKFFAILIILVVVIICIFGWLDSRRKLFKKSNS